MKTPLIECKDVSLGYGKRTILSGISFSLFETDFLGIVGPNGSGKTTLFRALLGIVQPQHGEIITHNRAQQPLTLGYVPQRDAIDPIMPYSVFDVVLMGRYGKLGLFRHVGEKDKAKVMEALRHVDIEDLKDNSFRDLSGGQKQRTLIARALASEPDILVLDEPTNGMDLTSRTAILELIKRLHLQDHLTVMMVSHMLGDVATYVNRIALVEGSMFQIGTREEILTEKNLTQVYKIPIIVGDFQGRTIVAAGGNNV
jgi:ABC-type Mn2+/Zn2+ transport system ATPase subunit